MRLRARLFIFFVAGFAATIGLLALAFPPLATRVTEAQLLSTARTVGLYLIHDLESIPYEGDEAAFERAVDASFEFIPRLAETTGEFLVKKTILIRPDYTVEVGHPSAEVGVDYSGHADVREAFAGAPPRVVIERDPSSPGGAEIDADIVAPIRLADGDSRVVEVKLDLSRSKALLGARYRAIQLTAAAAILAGFALLSAALLFGVGGSVIRPILRVSEAMDRVGEGDLDVRLGLRRGDEIGAMAARFYEMAKGLKERFELTRYVSRSTADAVRDRVESGGSAGKVERRRLAVFFSDVRGFTAYSESRPPERVIAVLNRLLGLQAEIIAEEGGDVDKFVGDETMAIFARPMDAMRAALRIRDAVEAASGELDGLRLGVGVHLGDLVEGDIGSPDMMDHTVIGDTVNTAARIQAAAGPGQILVTEELASEPGIAAACRLSGQGSVRAKGKSQPILVRALLGLKDGAGGA